MAASGFEKDFGYLMPFIEKVTEAANAISDASAREELKRLVAGERARWLRIEELLSGASAKPRQTVSPPTPVTPAKVAVDSPATAAAPPAPARQFTVGSLRPR
jgi:hypothetical protein